MEASTFVAFFILLNFLESRVYPATIRKRELGSVIHLEIVLNQFLQLSRKINRHCRTQYDSLKQ